MDDYIVSHFLFLISIDALDILGMQNEQVKNSVLV
jgi:hypothetical protein